MQSSRIKSSCDMLAYIRTLCAGCVSLLCAMIGSIDCLRLWVDISTKYHSYIVKTNQPFHTTTQWRVSGSLCQPITQFSSQLIRSRHVIAPAFSRTLRRLKNLMRSIALVSCGRESLFLLAWGNTYHTLFGECLAKCFLAKWLKYCPLSLFVISKYFPDIDECATRLHECSANAVCKNIVGSYNCTCNEGYYGDGKKCRG